MRRARVALGLLAVAVLGAAWWAWKRAPVPAGPSEGAAGHAGVAAPGTAREDGGVSLDAPALDASPRAERGAPAPARRTSGTSGARIHGRVTVAGVEGPLPPGARVDVCTLDGEEERLLRRAPVDAAGRYEVLLEADAVPANRGFVVCGVVPGWAWAREVVALAPGDDLDQDLAAGGLTQETLRVRVLDPADRPVAGLRLLVTTNPMRAADVPLPDPDAATYRVDRSFTVAALVTTDADGRFELKGLAGLWLKVDALDDGWHLSAGRQGQLLRGSVTLRAEPGYRLEGRVTDGETGAVLAAVDPMQEVRVGDRILERLETTGRAGSFRWSRPRPAGAQDGFELRVRWSAEGHRRAERVLSFRPGSWAQHVQVALERLRPEDVGRLRLLHEARDDAGRPLRLGVWIRDDDADPRRREEGVRLEYDPEGFGSVELPAGPSRLRVVPQGAGVGWLAWEGTVHVEGGRTSDVLVPFPATGAIRVRVTGPGPAGELRVVEPGGWERVTWAGGEDGEVLLLPRVPVGRWLLWFEERGRTSAVAVDVVAGAVAETVIPR